MKTNIKSVLRDFKKTSNRIGRAEIWSLNRAGRATHPEAKRRLRDKYNIKARTINKAKAFVRRANVHHKVYLLIYRDRRVNVKDYGIRQIRSGIRWIVKRGEVTNLDHGFKVGHNSPRQAFKLDKFGMIRTGNFKAKKGKSGRMIKRETIKSVTGPSVPQLLNESGINRHLRKFFVKKYRDNFNRRVKSI